MIRCHDFINGVYYEDPFTGEKISESEYCEMKYEEELLRQYQHYILIAECESFINNTFFYCDSIRWNYRTSQVDSENIIILSETEYIKNEDGVYYYRSYKGDDYLSLEVVCNKQIHLDKIDELYDFIVCVIKGKGFLYRKNQFIETIEKYVF